MPHRAALGDDFPAGCPEVAATCETCRTTRDRVSSMVINETFYYERACGSLRLARARRVIRPPRAGKAGTRGSAT